MATKLDSFARSPLAQAITKGEIRKSLGVSNDDLRVGLDVAKGMIQRGAPEEAMQIYLSLVLCDPGVVDFQVGLANCALLLDQAALALQAASVVVALAPADPRGYLLSGRACAALGAWREAVEDFTDAREKAKATRDSELYAQASGLLEIAVAQV